MRKLRIIRIFLATFFFCAAAAYLLIGQKVHPIVVVSLKTQIILSSVTVSAGVSLAWLLLTFLFGRIYCSTVCPIGALSDFFNLIGKRFPHRRPSFSYRNRRPWSIHILIVYLICIVAGITVVPYLVEPWYIMSNIAAAVNPSAIEATWIGLGTGAATGIVAGIVSFILIAAYSAWHGRAFCTDICPTGTALGLLHEHNIYHIEIDPDRCTSCGVCEDICRASCIKVVSRHVDNSRCVRCFDCLAACSDDAIHFQANRNRRPATPLLRKVKKSVN